MGRQKVGVTRATDDALRTLGSLVRQQRVARRITRAELADRAGVSTRTMSSIESGSPSTSIGNVFNVMLAAGLPLFGSDDPAELARMRAHTAAIAALLPKRVRHSGDDDDDDGLDF